MSSIWSFSRIDRSATRWRGPGRWSCALIALVAIVPLAMASARAEAVPARYVYEKCDSVLPGGGTAGVIVGQHPRFGFGFENTCARPGGALILRQPDLPPHDGGGASWGVPVVPAAGTEFESISITAAACGGASGFEVMAPSWPPVRCAEETRVFPLNKYFKGFPISLWCVDAGYDTCNPGPWVAAHYFATTVVDRVSPTLAGVGGSLLVTGVRRGRQTLSVEAADQGGGLSSVWPAVNGLPATQARSASCNVAYADNPSVKGIVAAQATPCPTELDAEWTLDTGAFPFRDGANRVAVCASDFATLGDPNTTCTEERTVVVDSSCTESPVPGGRELSAQFTRSNAETVTVGFGKGAVVTGELDDGAGDPVRGATLCVKMATLGVDERPEPVGAVKTDANGRFSYELAPGPNRELMIGYRHNTEQVARKVRFYAHAKPTLRATPTKLRNGKRVRFRGEVPAPRNGGRVVILQANVVGSKRWITFRKATTGERGGFHGSYLFRSTTRRTRYRFRALIPTQAGYPWVEGRSRPVEVVVDG